MMITSHDPLQRFLSMLSPGQQAAFRSLRSPYEIQVYLDTIPYIGEELDRSPLKVIQDQQCHCLDGGLLAATALRQLGHPAQILDLVPEPGTDDDHVLAVYRRSGRYGAVAKSNYVGLRFREPVYRSLRELVMSYFEPYFNAGGQKTLRGYSRLLRLEPFDRFGWMWNEGGVKKVTRRLYALKMIPVVRPLDVETLSPVDPKTYEAYTLGTNMNEVYRPAGSEGR